MRQEERLAGKFPRRSASQMAEYIPREAVLLVSGFGRVGYPKAIPSAITSHDQPFALTVISSGSVGDEIDSNMVKADAVERRFAYQATPIARESVNRNSLSFHDRHVSRMGDEVQFRQLANPDIAVIEAIAVGENWLIPSTSIGQTPAFVEAADEIIIEVNRALPLSLADIHDIYRPAPPPTREPIPLSRPCERIGSPKIHFEPDKLIGVVETELEGSPYEFRDPTPDDEAIANNLRCFLEKEIHTNPVLSEAVRVQFGVGSLGNALSDALSDISFGDRDVVYYGEVFQDGLLDLLEEDILSCASATSLALSTEGQARLFEDMEAFADDIILRPADISNNPELVARFGVISINSALEVDIYGHANSTHVRGTRMLNGVGGSGDFIRNGLVSVVALSSTISDGSIARIVPMVSHVDHTEHDIDVIITEQGTADLRGLSPLERADEIINSCAAPHTRESLHRYLKDAEDGGGHIHHDLEHVFDWEQTYGPID